MDWKQSYNDTCAELKILQLRELELRKIWEAARTAMDGHTFSLDRAFELEQKAAANLNAIVEECQRVEEIKRKMESYMDQFTNKADVILCKQMQGHGLKEISVMTGYSYGYVRQIAAKYNKERTDNAKISC